jgi:hypothetical protein
MKVVSERVVAMLLLSLSCLVVVDSVQFSRAVFAFQTANARLVRLLRHSSKTKFQSKVSYISRFSGALESG